MVSKNSSDNDKQTSIDAEIPKAPYTEENSSVPKDKINNIKNKEKSRKELKERLAEAKANYKLEQKLKEIKEALKIKNFKKSQDKLAEEVEKLGEKEQILEEKIAELATNPGEAEYANLILEQVKSKMIEVEAKEELATDAIGVKIARKTVSNVRKIITNILKGVKELLKAETKSLNQKNSEPQFDVDEVKSSKRKKKVIVNMLKEPESELSVPKVENIEKEEIKENLKKITEPEIAPKIIEEEKETTVIKEPEIISTPIIEKEKPEEKQAEIQKIETQKPQEIKVEKIPTPPLDQIPGHKEEPLELGKPNHESMQLEIRPEEIK